MEQKQTILLTGTETFSKGNLENTTLEDGYVTLERVAGRYLQFGAYTTPELALPPFCNLNMSWNADVPENTLIEVQCRVLVDGAWSGWLSFGKWALEYPRKSVYTIDNVTGDVFIAGDTITVGVPSGGTMAQVKVTLFTNDEKCTPALRLVSVSVRPLHWQRELGMPINRSIYLPEYSIGRHETIFGESMELPLVLTALMNRFGEDALPEEVAYGMADKLDNLCNNAAFGAAMVGCCGYECYQAWMDIKAIRGEIRNDCSVAVQLADSGASMQVKTHWVALHGFEHDKALSVDHVLLANPLAQSDEEVPYIMGLDRFEQMFTGRAILVHNKLHGVRKQRPSRVRCNLKAEEEDGAFSFRLRGEEFPLSEDFDGWIACAHKDGIAHATTAHRPFSVMEKTQTGGVRFSPECNVPGSGYTVYVVNESGSARAAEVRIPERKPLVEA